MQFYFVEVQIVLLSTAFLRSLSVCVRFEFTLFSFLLSFVWNILEYHKNNSSSMKHGIVTSDWRKRERERKTLFPFLLFQMQFAQTSTAIAWKWWQLLRLNVRIYWNKCRQDSSTLCICIAHSIPILLIFFPFFVYISNNYAKMNEVIFILKGVKLQNNELHSICCCKKKQAKIEEKWNHLKA